MKRKSKTIALPELVHGSQLSKLVNLSDMRLRQIAGAGHFPQPNEGMYQFEATITGLAKYYQESDKRFRGVKESIDGEKLRKLQLENDEAEGVLTNTAKLAESIAPMLTKFRDLVYAKFENEAPTSMAGLDVPSARIIGRRFAAELLGNLQKVFSEIKLK